MKVFIRRNNDKRGPFDLPTIQKGLDTGKLLPTDFAMVEGTGHWITVSQIPGVKCAALALPPTSASPPAPPHANLANTPVADTNSLEKKLNKWFLELAATLFVGYLLWAYVPAYRNLFIPKTPYSDWTLVYPIGNRKATKDLPGISVVMGEHELQGFSSTVSATVTNNSEFDLGPVEVFMTFTNGNKVTIAENSEFTGPMKKGDKWEVTFTVPQNTAFFRISHTIASEPSY